MSRDCTSSVKQSIGYVMCISGGIALGLTFDVNAILLHNLRPVVKLTYFASLYFTVSLIMAFYVEPIVIVMSVDQFLLLLAHSIGAAVTAFFTIYAVHMIGGVRASLAFNFHILLNLFVQGTVMKSILPGNGNWMEIIGALILVLGVTISPAIDIIQTVKQSYILP